MNNEATRSEAELKRLAALDVCSKCGSGELPDYCKAEEGCGLTACDTEIIRCHWLNILPAEFDARKRPPYSNGKHYTFAMMQAELAKGSCENAIAVFDAGVSTNDALELIVEPAQKIAPNRYYCYQLFSALQKDSPENYFFFRGQTSAGQPDVIFSVHKGGAVKFYDVSSDETVPRRRGGSTQNQRTDQQQAPRQR